MELYEKEGKRKRRADLCDDAGGSGQRHETDTQQSWRQRKRGWEYRGSYTVSAKAYEDHSSWRRGAFGDRTTKLPLPAGNANVDQKNATFALVFENGKKEVGVRFVSGAAELKEVGKGLATAKYQVAFPDERRRGCFAWGC